MRADLRALLAAARACGWEVTMTKKNHYKLTSPEGGAPVYSGGTPSDWRSNRNLRAHLRRRGVKV